MSNKFQVSRYLILLVVIMISTEVLAASKKTHMIIWGDSEGMLRRPGNNEKDINPAVVKLVDQLKKLDKEEGIDLIFCTGDFVRFDPTPEKPKQYLLYRYWPDKLLGKFYPTIGGDEEFTQGKYGYFIQTIGPWLKNVRSLEQTLTHFVAESQAAAGDSGKEYYYTQQAGVHIFSLWSPDNLDEPEKTPQYAPDDIFNPKLAPKLPQYKWLIRNLWQIRVAEGDKRPIVILSHRPVINRSGAHLPELFDVFDVDLVLSGDEHVYAKKTYRGVTYIVSGMMGDSLGGCQNLSKGYKGRRGNSFAQYIEPYEFCIPEKQLVREGKPYQPSNDHYLRAYFENSVLRVDAIQVEDEMILPHLSFKENLKREDHLVRQNQFWQEVQQ